MDPLSDVLALLKPRSYVASGFEAGGEWSIQFARHEGIKCYAVVCGQCWLCVDGIAEAVQLKAGDCFLLPSGRSFRLTSDSHLTPMDAVAVFSPAQRGGIAVVNGGGDFSLVGSHFLLTGTQVGFFLGVLPPIVHIRDASDQADLRWSLQRMRQELRERQPGGVLVAQHLAHLMLVQALRLHLAEGSRGGVGWLFALGDKQIGAAIYILHEQPSYGWTLQELAQRIGMSRSSFALRFKQLVGFSPMEYLTRWRMLLAGDRLVTSSDSIAAIALSLGYESESAFSTAFKRVMGRSPRQHSRGVQPVSPVQQDAGRAAGPVAG